jgi:hypothetical protein
MAMPADVFANGVDEDEGDNAGPAPQVGPKTLHDTEMRDLKEQIERLKAQKALRALEAERDALDRELATEKEMETPEGQARAKMEAQLKLELAKRSTARAEAREKTKEADDKAEGRKKQGARSSCETTGSAAASFNFPTNGLALQAFASGVYDSEPRT